jgi:hypothetical protein
MRIVRTKRYLKDIKRIGALVADVSALELIVASNPTAGDVVQGLGGIRKIRFGLGNRGKRGGGRAIYFLMLGDDTAVMLSVYAKNEMADLSSTDRKALVALVKELTDD